MWLLQSASVDSMHRVLENLYHEMLPLCSGLILPAQLIAAFGALWYIGYRVCKQIASAEPVDLFPLLRPFAISIAIGLFPHLIDVINGILTPVVSITQHMVNSSHEDVQHLLDQRELAASGRGPSVLLTDPGGQEAWDQFSAGQPSGGFWSSLLSLNVTQLCKLFFATLLELLYYAASLCIDCMRTFHLLILTILGPVVLALSIYDGFQHTLTTWLGRYINIYLWLPIANLFGALIAKLQAAMLRLDITQIQQGQEGAFSQTGAAYIIFMIIGIVGYLTIPSVANHIVHASGGGGLMNKINTLIASRININRFGGNTLNKVSSGAASFTKEKLTGK